MYCAGNTVRSTAGTDRIGSTANTMNVLELVKLISSCGISEQASTPLNTVLPNLTNVQDITTSSQPSLFNGSCDFGIWSDGSEQIKSLESCWPSQSYHKPVTRSHSAITNGSPSLLLTSSQEPLNMTSSIRSAAVGSELKSHQHRGLSRTTSDPIPARRKSGKNALTTSLSTSGDAAQAETPADRYKTELCRTFQDSGKCKYGDKCQFAHGKADQRTVVRHPKYKTDRCKTYHSTGYCPYGPRCHFVHDETELSPAVVAENEKRAEKLRLILEQQQQQQQQQQQLQRFLLLQKREQLRLAYLQAEQKLQNFNDSYFFGQITPAGLESVGSTTVTSAGHKYADSLGSAGTSSPPASVSDSRSPSPTSSLLDGELAQIAGQRSGSVDFSNFLLRQELGEMLSNSAHRTAEDLSRLSPRDLPPILIPRSNETLITDEIIAGLVKVLQPIARCNQQNVNNAYGPSVNFQGGISADSVSSVNWSYSSLNNLVV